MLHAIAPLSSTAFRTSIRPQSGFPTEPLNRMPSDLTTSFSLCAADPSYTSTRLWANNDKGLKTIVICQDQDELQKLSRGHFRLCLARTFLSKGMAVSNVVWKSFNLAPRTPVTWRPSSYALNWTDYLPDSPAEAMNLSGLWQPCRPGEAYDLNSTGLWSASTIDPKPGMLMVGINQFKTENGTGPFIVLGLEGLTKGQFESVFVDRVELGSNMSAWIQPSEMVQWWYEAGPKSINILSDVGSKDAITPIEQKDTAGEDTISSTYDYDNGRWITS